MTFREAVRSTPAVQSHLRNGLQALRGVDRNRLHSAEPRRFRGSVNLEEALSPSGPGDPRWDYGIGVARRAGDLALWLEVHPASSAHHLEEVRRKLDWLKKWLRVEAPALESLPPRFVWLASGSVCFHSGSPQRRRIAQFGLLFRAGRLDVDRLGNP